VARDMAEYRKLTRRGKTLEPDADIHSKQNIRKRWKFQNVIMRFLAETDEWVSTRAVQTHLAEVYPKSAPTTNQCARYLSTMSRRGEIILKRGKPTKWRINQ